MGEEGRTLAALTKRQAPFWSRSSCLPATEYTNNQTHKQTPGCCCCSTRTKQRPRTWKGGVCLCWGFVGGECWGGECGLDVWFGLDCCGDKRASDQMNGTWKRAKQGNTLRIVLVCVQSFLASGLMIEWVANVSNLVAKFVRFDLFQIKRETASKRNRNNSHTWFCQTSAPGREAIGKHEE